MNQNEREVLALMRSVQAKYFPQFINIIFQVEKDCTVDGVWARMIFGVPCKLILYYGDDRVIAPHYRMALVPILAHELAHLVDSCDPERVLKECLPKPMFDLWQALRESGLAICSMDVKAVTE